MIFKMYNCDLGVKINGTSYDFTHVNNLQIEDPESTKLIRGGNASNKLGLIYKDGIKEPKKITVTIIDMSSDLKSVLDSAYADKTRVDVYCVDRIDGSSKMAKNAILSQQPQQLSVDDTTDSMSVALVFESFDLTETHKS
jgi:hypothetical protein